MSSEAKGQQKLSQNIADSLIVKKETKPNSPQQLCNSSFF